MTIRSIACAALLCGVLAGVGAAEAKPATVLGQVAAVTPSVDEVSVIIIKKKRPVVMRRRVIVKKVIVR